jgi:hypothetical protein
MAAAVSHAKHAVRLVRRLTRRQTGPTASQSSDPGAQPAEAADLNTLSFHAGMVLAAAHAAAGNGSEALATYQKLVDDGRFPDVGDEPPPISLLQAHAICRAAALGVIIKPMSEYGHSFPNTAS